METQAQSRTAVARNGGFLTTRLGERVVADAMQHGVLTCRSFTPLVTVARTMATHHVHSVVVTGRRTDDPEWSATRAWGIVTDVDLLQAAGHADELTALDIANTAVETVTPETPLHEAAKLMARHRISHMVGIDSRSDEPVGMLSSLDVAREIAWKH